MKKSENQIHFNPEILFKNCSPSPNHIEKRKSSKLKEKNTIYIIKKLNENLAKYSNQRGSKFKSKSFDPLATNQTKPPKNQKLKNEKSPNPNQNPNLNPVLITNSNVLTKTDKNEDLKEKKIEELKKVKDNLTKISKTNLKNFNPNNKKSLAELFKPHKSISPNFSTRRLISSNLQEKVNKSKFISLLNEYKKDFLYFNKQKVTKYCLIHQEKKSLHFLRITDSHMHIGFCTLCKINYVSKGYELEDIKMDSNQDDYDPIIIDINREIKNYELLQEKRVKQLHIDKKQFENQKKNITNFFKKIISLFKLKEKLYLENFEFSYLKEKNYLDLLKNLINRNLKDMNNLKSCYIKNKNENLDNNKSYIFKKINYFKEIANTCKFTRLDIFPKINILEFCKDLNSLYENLWSEKTFELQKDESRILGDLENNYEIYDDDEQYIEDGDNDNNFGSDENEAKKNNKEKFKNNILKIFNDSKNVKNRTDSKKFEIIESQKHDNISPLIEFINKLQDSKKSLQVEDFQNHFQNENSEPISKINSVHHRSFKSISTIKGSLKTLEEFENPNGLFCEESKQKVNISNDFSKKNKLFNFKKNPGQLEKYQNYHDFNLDPENLSENNEVKNENEGYFDLNVEDNQDDDDDDDADNEYNDDDRLLKLYVKNDEEFKKNNKSMISSERNMSNFNLEDSFENHDSFLNVYGMKNDN